MLVTLHAVAYRRAIENVQRGKRRGGFVALVVLGHGSKAIPAHRRVDTSKNLDFLA